MLYHLGSSGNWAGSLDSTMGQPVLALRPANRSDIAHENGHLRCE